MPKYEIELTDAEAKAISYTTLDAQDFAKSTLVNEAFRAKELILVENMKHCNANKITIADTEEKQIDQAFDVGAVKTVKERNAEAEANAPK